MATNSLWNNNIETWAREYYAETEQGFGTTVENMSASQHSLVEKISAGAKDIFYVIACGLLYGKGFMMPTPPRHEKHFPSGL